MIDFVTAKQKLVQSYLIERNKTKELCQPLAVEDYVIQSSDDVSPPKWHLAHTTWFFETFLLMPRVENYQPFDRTYHYLFNSYYQRIGHPYPKIHRGLLSRPTVDTIYSYRHSIDSLMVDFLEQQSEEELERLYPVFTLGLQHEQQHQELLLMDIKHNLSQHPDFPAYGQYISNLHSIKTQITDFLDVPGALTEIGYRGKHFCFDNELPRHKQVIIPFSIANRLVTNGEYCEFIEARGYQNPEWWLADGWDCVQKNRWQAPLYWHKFDNQWYIYTLSGLRELDLSEPVSHVSYYEADAYARWQERRLPTESEWEHFVTSNKITPDVGNFMETEIFHPRSQPDKGKNIPAQFFGDVWEWTSSPYSPYPGYKPPDGAISEYNGKFMSNQFVLRGGCCVTPRSHIRASYRNFYQPDKRWQFGGIRLASDIPIE